MQKQEFEERIERTVTDEQYKVIEEVYMWHPSILNTSGKDEVAEGTSWEEEKPELKRCFHCPNCGSR